MTGDTWLSVELVGNVNEDVAPSSLIGELIISSREGIGSLREKAVSVVPIPSPNCTHFRRWKQRHVRILAPCLLCACLYADQPTEVVHLIHNKAFHAFDRVFVLKAEVELLPGQFQSHFRELEENLPIPSDKQARPWDRARRPGTGGREPPHMRCASQGQTQASS